MLKSPLANSIRAASPKLYISQKLLFDFANRVIFNKEQYYFTVRTRAHDFREQARNIPTQLSHVGLLPVSEHLLSIVEEQYAQLVITSAAQLTIRLAVDSYFKGKKSEVKLQVKVANRKGCSPASDVCLILGPVDSEYFEASECEHKIASTLRGGAEESFHVNLTLREEGIKSQAFPMLARVQFLDRVGKVCSSEDVRWTVQLYKEDQYLQEFETNTPHMRRGGL